MRRVPLTCGLLAVLAAPALGQRTQWSDVVYVPGRWQAGRLVRATTRNAATDTLALVMRVDYFASSPRWRAEIRRSTDGQSFGTPDVVFGNGATVEVQTPLGVTPLAQHALGRDSLAVAAVAVMDAAGRARGPASRRIAETAGAAGPVTRVIFRRPQRNPSFSAELLSPGRQAGGRVLLASGIQSVGDQRSASVVATAGARGVDRVRTPRGEVPVHPDTTAVSRMERFAVGAVRLEDFLRAGALGPYAPSRSEVRP